MYPISNTKIDNTLDILFHTQDDFFECGFDYYSYPSYQILFLKYLIMDIDIDFGFDYSVEHQFEQLSQKNYLYDSDSSDHSDNTDNSDNSDNSDYCDNICMLDKNKKTNLTEPIGVTGLNINKNLVFGQIFSHDDIVYDDLHMYLISVVKQREFSGFNLINKIFTISTNKLIDFSFDIQLYNTTTSEYVSFEVNHNNISNIFEQMYWEKLGYVSPNFRLYRRELADRYICYENKKRLLERRDIRIYQYTEYFKHYVKNYLVLHKNKSIGEIKQLQMQKIQNYSFGIVILNFISTFYAGFDKYDEIFVKLLQIALQCCITQYYDPESKSWYINQIQNFNEIENLYYNLAEKIQSK
jgi:hypothetical protein